MTSFYFYDLETSGFNPSMARVMQFAGQRVDENLKPVGEPHNFLIKMTPDVLPDPGAVLVTGITPQKTIEEGITEAEFLKIFHKEIATPDTIFVGFNTVRFDDEFMRYLNYRNFRDPYEWSWKDGRSRWDLLDVVRMTRALRPEGIKWPSDDEGGPTNTLVLLAELNNLKHESAHDALSDVHATIALARLLKSKQPKLFDYLLNLRDKRKVQVLAESGQPFVYTSGRYPGEFEKTTVAKAFGSPPDTENAALVFDLRFSPAEFAEHSPDEMVKNWKLRFDEREFPIPVKTLKYNRCPAIAPLNVLDEASQKRLKLDMALVKKHEAELADCQKELADKVCKTLNLLSKDRQARFAGTEQEADARLYDGFFSDNDRAKLAGVQKASPPELAPDSFTFKDDRLNQLLPLYKARNFPASLTDEERQTWEAYRQAKLTDGGQESAVARYLKQIDELAASATDKNNQYLLEELRLYAESLL